MEVNYTFNNGGTTTSFDDAFIRRDKLTTGNLWMWGYNSSGGLGDNTIANKSSPVQTVAGGTNWKSISGNKGIKNDGTLWVWGVNNYGQLGINSLLSRSSPVQTVAGGTNWALVSAGNYHTAAIKTDGTLWIWGYNSVAALGTNNLTSRSSPVQTISAGFNWKQVSVGNYHSAAIKTDGRLWMWGYNTGGQLGDNTIVTKSSPVQTIAAGTNWKLISSGAYHMGAIKTDGTLWVWGLNNYGQLGDNTIAAKSSPIQTIAGGSNWKQVASGAYSTAAIKNDGTLWLWGKNSTGTLGDNTRVAKSSPVQTISGGTNWKQVSLGGSGEAVGAIKTDGTLWMWGANNFGQLADGTILPKSSPVQTVAGGTNWKLISGLGVIISAEKDIY